MNRQEFFRRLEYLLRGIPENERMDALAYYNDYFDDAGVENEQQVIRELGSPEAVAQIIIEDYRKGQQGTYGDYDSSSMKKGNPTTIIDKIKNMDMSKKIMLIIILVLSFPIWIGVVAGLFGAVVGVLGALFGVVVGVGGSGIGMLVGGLVCVVFGILRLFMSPAEGVVTLGIGALLTAISVLLILLFVLLAFKWLPTLVKAIIKWIKGWFNRQEGGDEI